MNIVLPVPRLQNSVSLSHSLSGSVTSAPAFPARSEQHKGSSLASALRYTRGKTLQNRQLALGKTQKVHTENLQGSFFSATKIALKRMSHWYSKSF